MEKFYVAYDENTGVFETFRAESEDELEAVSNIHNSFKDAEEAAVYLNETLGLEEEE